MLKVPVPDRFHIRRLPQRHQVHDFNILHMRSPPHHGFYQRFRFGATGMDVHAHAGLQVRQGIV
jgi:hypothetical protein